MAGMFFLSLIYLIPLASIVFFIVSLCCFISANKRYKAEPNDLNGHKKQTTKTLLIVSSIIMGVLIVIVVAFMLLMFAAVAYM